MKLKKKVFIGMATMLFAVATVFNMNMLNDNGAGDVSLDDVAVMAKAQDEASRLTGWLYDNFGGHWLSDRNTCKKTNGYTEAYNAHVLGNMKAEANISVGIGSQVGNTRYNYETTYTYVKCIDGRGNCWTSEECD